MDEMDESDENNFIDRALLKTSSIPDDGRQRKLSRDVNQTKAKNSISENNSHKKE